MLNESVWTFDAAVPDHPDALPSRADVVVIGTGVSGLTCAYALAKSGRSVVALDRGPVVAPSIAGIVHAGVDGSHEALIERVGEEDAASLLQAAGSASARLRHLIADADIECDLEQTGVVSAAVSSGEAKRLARDADRLEDLTGVSLEALGPDAGVELGIEGFRGGVFDPEGATVDMGRFVAGLVRAVTSAGALSIGHTEVRHIERKTTGYQVLTNTGKMSTGDVVLATSGHSGPLVSHVQRRVVPRAVHLYALDAAPSDKPTIVFSRGPVVRRSGRVVIADRSDPAGSSDAGDVHSTVMADVAERIPDLADASATHGWTIRQGHAFDGLPHIGEFDGMTYLVGQGQRDLPVGVAMGLDAAAALIGDIRRSPFEVAHAPGRWWYRGDPWFLNLAGRVRAR
ncbi:MAG: FAD-binding oxidoreductase [Acidimicrobiia bacterium]|nr:FAD-binding oxidoreductase [Acidimicrobiia bacterium]